MPVTCTRDRVCACDTSMRTARAVVSCEAVGGCLRWGVERRRRTQRVRAVVVCAGVLSRACAECLRCACAICARSGDRGGGGGARDRPGQAAIAVYAQVHFKISLSHLGFSYFLITHKCPPGGGSGAPPARRVRVMHGTGPGRRQKGSAGQREAHSAQWSRLLSYTIFTFFHFLSHTHTHSGCARGGVWHAIFLGA